MKVHYLSNYLLVIYAYMSARSEENEAAADREFLIQRLPFKIFFFLQFHSNTGEGSGPVQPERF